MMPYLSEKQLGEIGFKSVGKHVQVSDRASIYNADCIELGDYSRIDDFCVVSGRAWIKEHFLMLSPPLLILVVVKRLLNIASVSNPIHPRFLILESIIQFVLRRCIVSADDL